MEAKSTFDEYRRVDEQQARYSTPNLAYDSASATQSRGGGGRGSRTPYYDSDYEHGRDEASSSRELHVARTGAMNVIRHAEPEVHTEHRVFLPTLTVVPHQEAEHRRGNHNRYDVNSVASSPARNSVASSPVPNSVASSPYPNSVASSPVPNSVASSPVPHSVASSPGPVEDYFEECDGFVEEEDVYMEDYEEDW